VLRWHGEDHGTILETPLTMAMVLRDWRWRLGLSRTWAGNAHARYAAEYLWAGPGLIQTSAEFFARPLPGARVANAIVARMIVDASGHKDGDEENA
jgi:hypothetical protein